MRHELMFSGIGGQGVMLLGELLCSTAVKSGHTVTFAPSYGQEKRGGKTMCQIVISDEMGSPVISAAELLMVFDEKSLVEYEHIVKENGIIMINSSLIKIEPTRKDVQLIKVPINDLAQEIGNPKTANMVALGAVLNFIDYVDREEVKAQVTNLFPPHKADLIEINQKAVETGFSYVANLGSR
jgi:2-oxoglutarate ferredoxin oxidoreductase subunit gamma